MILDKIVINPKSEEEWRAVERELFRRGYMWASGPDTAEEALKQDYSAFTGEDRQIFVHGEHCGGLAGTLLSGRWGSREDADSSIIDADNFLRYTDMIVFMHGG